MKRIWVLSVVAGMLTVAGCLGPTTSGVAAERGRLTVENRAFASRLEVVQDQTVFTDNGFLKAQVTLRNTTKRNLRAQYCFTWKDRDGLTLKNAATPWMPLAMHGREEAVLEAVCPVPKAADFRLVVRPAENP